MTVPLKLKTYIAVFILKFFKLVYVLAIVKKTYAKTPTYSISKQYRVEQEPENPDLIYGELAISSFLYLLALIPKKMNCKIYDLGCGDARLLLSAALFYNHLKAVGIEKITTLHNIASSIVLSMLPKIIKNNCALNIIEDSFLKVNFFDADIVYVNGAALKETTWNQLCERFNHLKKGSYVISVERKFENRLFPLIYSGKHNASWGRAWVYIYSV